MDDWVWDTWQAAEAKMAAANDRLLDARVMKTRVILQFKANGFSQEATAVRLGFRPATPGGEAKGALTTYFRAAKALEKAGRAGLAIDAPITDADRVAVAATWASQSARVSARRSDN